MISAQRYTPNSTSIPKISGKDSASPFTHHALRITHYGPRLPGNRFSSGVVLFMVLILTTIMYLIAGTLLIITMTEVHLADFGQRSIQAFYAAESSIALGLSRLRTNSNYRSNTSDTITIGGNTGMLTAKFYDGTDDSNGYYRSSLSPSLYHLVLQGIGTVPGSKTSAKRTVEREIVVKPFALFARNNLTLAGGSTITGNIHGNNPVTIEAGSTVTGDATSNVIITNNGTVTGTESSLEPKITLPAFPIDRYFPKYWYNGTEYDAKPLAEDTVTLTPVGETPPPEPGIVKLYSGFPTADNPAGVFYPDSAITGTLTALQVNGTVIIPSPGALSINGAVTIAPVDNFPALISAKNLNVTLIGNLETFSDNIEKSRIQGLIYVQGNISFTGTDTTGEIITGSIFGRNITITGNPVFQVTYDPAIMSNPPPGIDLIEPGEWKELFE
jgi:hypothetical protein